MIAAPAGGCASRKVTVANQRGLHARAAAKLVKVASQYDAEVTVTKDGVSVSGSSIMGLMMLAAVPGTDLQLSAEGPDAKSVLDALEQLVADKFDED
ncbi:MAG: HPr family phosphocarrier protein [Rhodovibrionaceae bacterium]|nr:HPr family phosphocarrier protein [Rhodovibrionaceae bacterium]